MTQEQIGRLAFRKEGDNWIAYYAHANTMEGAFVLGSLEIGLSTEKKYRDRFTSLMRDIVGDMVEKATGHRPDWGIEEPAPEHERIGNA